MLFFNIIAVIIVLFAIISFFRELSRYKFTRNVSSLLVRLCMSVLLLFMVSTIICGIYIFDLNDPVGIYNIWTLFWFAEFMIAISVIILSFVEIKYFRVYSSNNSKRVTKGDIDEIINNYKKDKNNDN